MRERLKKWPIALCALTLVSACGASTEQPDDAGAADAADDAVGDVAADTTVPDIAALPTDRSILDWQGTTATDYNAKTLPAGFSKIDQTVCAKDPARQYIGELVTHGISDIQVDFHWAPVVLPQDPNPAHRSLAQPEWSMAGEVVDPSVGNGDVLADHPFGSDFNTNVKMDAAYAFLSGDGTGDGGPGGLHVEYEKRIMPHDSLGFVPAPGDRTIMRGVWILDCGHPPYGPEMHPPTVVAYARAADAKTTTATAFTLPYRSSLLFNDSVALATDLSSTARFDADGTATFPHAMIAAVLEVASGTIPNLTSHNLMLANRFPPLDWLVCAPSPRPTGAVLEATWRIAARTGVQVTVQPDDVNGCLRVHAEMTPAYVPKPLVWADEAWDWQGLSDSAGGQLGSPIDVRKEIIKILAGMGMPTSAPGLQADHPPHVDAYAQLPLRPDAAQDTPTLVDLHADDQAYPFYGRFRVGWK